MQSLSLRVVAFLLLEIVMQNENTMLDYLTLFFKRKNYFIIMNTKGRRKWKGN